MDSLMKQNRINVADYDLYRSHVQSLRWDAQENRSAYLPAWLSMLVAEAKMAIDDPSEHDLGYILRELYIALGELRHGAGVAAQQQAGPAPLQMVQ